MIFFTNAIIETYLLTFYMLKVIKTFKRIELKQAQNSVICHWKQGVLLYLFLFLHYKILKIKNFSKLSFTIKVLIY